MKNITNKRKNAGFTLLELVVVVAVMGLISTMAMDVYTDNSNQKRFEATKERLAEIKFAIIGDPMMRVGNQRVLNGFYHDVERLPNTLSELIYPCIQPSGEGISAADKITCESGSNNWVSDNWNGPYLTNIQSDENELVFRDAWGNNSTNGNYGWNYNGSVSPTDNLWVKSYGLDRLVDSAHPNGYSLSEYEQDYPSAGNLINQATLEVALELKGLASDSVYLSAVNNNALTNNKDYCLVIKSGSNIYISESKNISLEQNQPQTLNFSNFKNDASGSTILSLPHGNYTYKFYEDSVSTPCPVIGTAPATSASKALYIKENGIFATLKIFS